MKTARQWLYELDANETGGATCSESEIAQIQLDAWQQAMTDAAAIVDDARSGEESDLRSIRESIKSARDAKNTP